MTNKKKKAKYEEDTMQEETMRRGMVMVMGLIEDCLTIVENFLGWRDAFMGNTMTPFDILFVEIAILIEIRLLPFLTYFFLGPSPTLRLRFFFLRRVFTDEQRVCFVSLCFHFVGYYLARLSSLGKNRFSLIAF